MGCKKCQDGSIYICNNCGGHADYDHGFQNVFCNTCEIQKDEYTVYSYNCPDCNKSENEEKKNKKKYILFFDTETTGLPKNWKAPITDTQNWPRLVQLAYQIYDNGNKIDEQDFIIYPNGYSIPLHSSKIHGISDEKARTSGKQIQKVLSDFLIALKSSHTIVGHNIEFDINIVGCEFIRIGLTNPFENIDKICTMENSTNFCAINGPYGYKWPKLSELYFKLFARNFEDSHNASIDIKATVDCFWELVRRKIIKLDIVAPLNFYEVESPLFDEVIQSVMLGKEAERVRKNTCKKCSLTYENLVVYCDNCGEKINPSKIDTFPYPNKEYYELNDINEVDLYLAKEMGSEAIQENCFYEGIEYFRKAIELTPSGDSFNNADSLNGIGICFFKLKNYREAINYFSKIIDLLPAFPFSYENIIASYFNLNEFEKMFEICESMPSTIEVTPQIWYYVGKANEYLGSYSISRTAFQNAINGGMNESFDDLTRILKKINLPNENGNL